MAFDLACQGLRNEDIEMVTDFLKFTYSFAHQLLGAC